MQNFSPAPRSVVTSVAQPSRRAAHLHHALNLTSKIKQFLESRVVQGRVVSVSVASTAVPTACASGSGAPCPRGGLSSGFCTLTLRTMSAETDAKALDATPSGPRHHRSACTYACNAPARWSGGSNRSALTDLRSSCECGPARVS